MLSEVADVPIFQHDWCSIVIVFSSDSFVGLIFRSSGFVFPARPFFQKCPKTDAFYIVACDNTVRSCMVKFSV